MLTFPTFMYWNIGVPVVPPPDWHEPPATQGITLLVVALVALNSMSAVGGELGFCVVFEVTSDCPGSVTLNAVDAATLKNTLVCA